MCAKLWNRYSTGTLPKAKRIHCVSPDKSSGTYLGIYTSASNDNVTNCVFRRCTPNETRTASDIRRDDCGSRFCLEPAETNVDHTRSEAKSEEAYAISIDAYSMDNTTRPRMLLLHSHDHGSHTKPPKSVLRDSFLTRHS